MYRKATNSKSTAWLIIIKWTHLGHQPSDQEVEYYQSHLLSSTKVIALLNSNTIG